MANELLATAASLALGELLHVSPGHASQVGTAITALADAKHAGGDVSSAEALVETALGVAAAAFPQNTVLAKAGAITGVVEAFPQTIAEYDQGDAVEFPITPTIRGHQALILVMRRDGRAAAAVLGS